MKKWIVLILALLIFLGSVWFVITLRRVASDQVDASNRGLAYNNFFKDVMKYVEETNAFPQSAEEIQRIYRGFPIEGGEWLPWSPTVVDLIEPNFDITPTPGNLEEFAPDYRTRADLAAHHCEYYWDQILETLARAP